MMTLIRLEWSQLGGNILFNSEKLALRGMRATNDIRVIFSSVRILDVKRRKG